MSSKPKLSAAFGIPEYGWLHFNLGWGEIEIEEYISDLQPALLNIKITPQDQDIIIRVFICERRDDDTTKHLILEAIMPHLEVCITFWRALRRLQFGISEEHWRHPFPTREMDILTSFVKTQKTNNSE